MELMMGYISPHIVWTRKLEGIKLKDGEIWFGHISAPSAKEITTQHSLVLLECYIDPAILNNIAADNNVPPGAILRDQFLPDEVKVKNGDFGEVLARSVIQESRDHLCFPMFRWRNRAHKNDTVRGIDLLGYVMPGEEPNDDDKLILCEVKTRTSKRRQIVEDAYKDAKTHSISRLANSLYFIQNWLRQYGYNDEAKKFSRFSNPHRVPFNLHLLPCVVHESKIWDDSYLDILPEIHSNGEYKDTETVDVIVISVENLTDWIDEVHKTAAMCAGL
jgi:hypothetical protein